MTEEENKLNDLFKQEALAAEKAEKERSANKGKSYSKDYETLEWSGLEVGVTKVYRVLGDYPDLNMVEGSHPKDKFCGRVVNICKIKDDKNKMKRFIIPCKNKDDSHIIWRIVDAVNACEWVDKKDGTNKKEKKFLYETKHPELFSMVNRNNFPVNDKIFGLKVKGWKGGEFFITNVIDRTDPVFHAEKKHSKLIAKSVSVLKGDDNIERTFIEEGVPAFGFTGELNRIFKTYGFPSLYDIGVERTGKQNPSLLIMNASRTPEMCRENEKFVVVGPLTDDEKAYTSYNLDKLFGVSSYTKIYNSLNKSISMIDAALGTHFLSELKSLSDEEKAKWEDKDSTQADDEDEEEPSNNSVAEYSVSNKDEPKFDDDLRAIRKELTEDEPPVRTIRKEEIEDEPPARTVQKKKVNPPAFDQLLQKDKDMIESSEPPVSEGEPWVIRFKGIPPEKKLPKCPECMTRTPVSFSHCPVCGISFDFG